MHYTIKTMYGKSINIDGEFTNINDIKNEVYNKIGTPIDKQRLLINGKLITEIPKPNSIISLVFKLIGG